MIISDSRNNKILSTSPFSSQAFNTYLDKKKRKYKRSFRTEKYDISNDLDKIKKTIQLNKHSNKPIVLIIEQKSLEQAFDSQRDISDDFMYHSSAMVLHKGKVYLCGGTINLFEQNLYFELSSKENIKFIVPDVNIQSSKGPCQILAYKHAKYIAQALLNHQNETLKGIDKKELTNKDFFSAVDSFLEQYLSKFPKDFFEKYSQNSAKNIGCWLDKESSAVDVCKQYYSRLDRVKDKHKKLLSDKVGKIKSEGSLLNFRMWKAFLIYAPTDKLEKIIEDKKFCEQVNPRILSVIQKHKKYKTLGSRRYKYEIKNILKDNIQNTSNINCFAFLNRIF